MSDGRTADMTRGDWSGMPEDADHEMIDAGTGHSDQNREYLPHGPYLIISAYSNLSFGNQSQWPHAR